MANKDLTPNRRPEQPPDRAAPTGPVMPNTRVQKEAAPGNSADEQLKQLLEQLADKDPAYIAEIIHQWLS